MYVQPCVISGFFFLVKNKITVVAFWQKIK